MVNKASVNKTMKRRDFLKFTIAGLATTTVAATTMRNKASGPVGESPHKWVMVIDQSKCNGCGHCVDACRAENDVSPDQAWTRIIALDPVGEQELYLPMPCMHCADAPCVDICPVGASSYRPDGIVMMDYDKCIGCRYCQLACPYNARVFNWKAFTEENPAVPTWGEPGVERRPRGVVEKCSFCYQRIDRGLEMGLTPGVDAEATPACVVACPPGARIFGDLNDPNSEVSRLVANNCTYRLREELGTEPGVYYLPVNDPAKEAACPDSV
jgi:phenylacetyl-CoA:acceptor oxidoreductase subunit 1